VHGDEDADRDDESEHGLSEIDHRRVSRAAAGGSVRVVDCILSRSPHCSAEDAATLVTDRAGVARVPPLVYPNRPASSRPSAKIGTAAVRLSIRSRTPPWPGRSRPLSLSPTLRLKRLTFRSPSTEKNAVTSAITSSTPTGRPSRHAMSAPTSPAAASPPLTPSHVLPGLTAGASFLRPNRRPQA